MRIVPSQNLALPNCDPSVQLLAHRNLLEVLQRLPYMALIVTAASKVVFANQMLLDTLGLTDLSLALSRRPGELLLCVNSRTPGQGCGGAEGCHHCQAAHAIADALQTGGKIVREARLTTRQEGRLVAHDFKVTAMPLEFTGEALAMVFLEDISALKRREHLESIFLHDLANTIGCLQLMTELHDQDPSRVCHEKLRRQVELLTGEVRTQQILNEAESGRLERDIQYVAAELLLEKSLDEFSAFSEKHGIAIVLELPQAPVYLATDLLLAKRVLSNAIKNAMEASTPGESVKITVACDELSVAIAIWNPGAMEASTQHQVFQRSFSTKGKGRGLGTYSMRLLMENYLGGTVSFTSDPGVGTTFTFNFPSMQSYLAKVG